MYYTSPFRSEERKLSVAFRNTLAQYWRSTALRASTATAGLRMRLP
jgi:hypothetical protein